MPTNISNCISNLLSIKDPNITFSGEYSEKIIHGLKTIVYDATLTYHAKSCVHCGNADESKIIKNGSKHSTVRLLPVNGEPMAINLKKQRFLCKECGRTFIRETSLVEKNFSISRPLKAHVLRSLSQKISEKDIAFINNISHSTVSRYIDNSFYDYLPMKNFLPKNMSFDEFKSTRDSKGSMSFIVTDLDKRSVFDIVENRQLQHLKRYFLSFERKARKKVKTVTIDIYKPYIALIKELFHNADIIFDRFHIINLLSRALLKTRIEVMKYFPTSSKEYKILKRYWKIIQKDSNDLNDEDYKHWVHFRERRTESGVVYEAVSVDDILKETYDIYQILLSAIKSRDKEALRKRLLLFKNKGSEYMKTAIKTLLEYFEFVGNALDYKYSNGFTEGINNYIKVFKRIAFGYKSFIHFRNRLLIALRLKEMIGFKTKKMAA